MNHIQEHINTSTRKHPHVEHMEININEIYKNIERERERRIENERRIYGRIHHDEVTLGFTSS